MPLWETSGHPLTLKPAKLSPQPCVKLIRCFSVMFPGKLEHCSQLFSSVLVVHWKRFWNWLGGLLKVVYPRLVYCYVWEGGRGWEGNDFSSDRHRHNYIVSVTLPSFSFSRQHCQLLFLQFCCRSCWEQLLQLFISASSVLTGGKGEEGAGHKVYGAQGCNGFSMSHPSPRGVVCPFSWRLGNFSNCSPLCPLHNNNVKSVK